MKKTLKFMMMALVAIVMSVGFAACSSSDDDNNTPGTPENPENPETPSASKESYLKIKIQLSDDLLSVADVTIEYTGEDGSTKTESITEKSFEKKVVYKNEPSTMQANVKFTLKENYPAKDTYDLSCSNEGTTAQFKTGGGTVGGKTYKLAKVKADGLSKGIKYINDMMKLSFSK